MTPCGPVNVNRFCAISQKIWVIPDCVSYVDVPTAAGLRGGSAAYVDVPTAAGLRGGSAGQLPGAPLYK